MRCAGRQSRGQRYRKRAGTLALGTDTRQRTDGDRLGLNELLQRIHRVAKLLLKVCRVHLAGEVCHSAVVRHFAQLGQQHGSAEGGSGPRRQLATVNGADVLLAENVRKVRRQDCDPRGSAR